MNPYTVDPDTPGLRPADQVRLARLEGMPASWVKQLAASYGLSPDGSPLPPTPPRPRRVRPVVVHGLTSAERQLLATGPPPVAPRPPRRVTLEDVRALPQPPAWAERLVASAPPAHVRSVAVTCAHCGIRHRLDFQCEAARNHAPAGSYSDLVASGRRLT